MLDSDESSQRNGANIFNEIAEVHSATARTPSPKPRRSRSRSSNRKLSNGHGTSPDRSQDTELTERVKRRDSWINSDYNESQDTDVPIHDQIKKDILQFVGKELKKTEVTGESPSFVFYSHDPTDLDEKYLKTLSRPSSGYKEKRSPSYRRKKRHSSKVRERDQHDFEIPGSSLSALEKVDDYLKEYNKAEVVTLSGDLEIDSNDIENNNGSPSEIRKTRKTRRKLKMESGVQGRDVSPKVFKASKAKAYNKTARPTNITAMIESLEASRTYTDSYIDNPFSSPSPMTSPNDDRRDPFGRTSKVYLQSTRGTFQAVSNNRILNETQKNKEEDKYFRFGDLTPVDIALLVQKCFKNISPACHGVLAGLALMHLLLISHSDSQDAGHLSFHSMITMPYVTAYYFFCTICLVSVLDRLDPFSVELSGGLQPYFQPIVLAVLYTTCMLVCMSSRMYDEMMTYHSTNVYNLTGNYSTMPSAPEFYATWSHLSIWRAVLSILGLVYFMITNPQDLLYNNLTKLLQYTNQLPSIGSR